MCGIIGYNGDESAPPILLEGLKRLEYRGYDSAGIAVVGSPLQVTRCVGKVSDLAAILERAPIHGSLGIGHTRWATHGGVTETNAHPHASSNGSIAVVHNGIIENYAALRESLKRSGHAFKGETDTEVLVRLIEEKRKDAPDLHSAVRSALSEVRGAYAVGVISSEHPDQLLAARMGSPLVVGVGEHSRYFIASDATPLIGLVSGVAYLNDGEMAVITREGFTVTTLDGSPVHPKLEELHLSAEDLQKGGHPHFMRKEIFEQPHSVRRAMLGRLAAVSGSLSFDEIPDGVLAKAGRFLFVACGTSWHASLVAKRLFEEFAKVPSEVEFASEFRYRNPIIRQDDVVIAVSQSGETADTLAAMRLAKEKGATVIAVTNVVGSSIARASDVCVYLQAGPEISVASTKAFTAQVTVLALLALSAAIEKGSLSPEAVQKYTKDLDAIPEHISSILEDDALFRRIAEKWKSAPFALFLGRGYGMPVALEGALKLKEISYIPSEGYPAGEMKHGPIALVEPGVPTFVIATRHGKDDVIYEKVVSNIEEVRARGGPIIAIATEGDSEIVEHADDLIFIPGIAEPLEPLLTVIPLQLLAYHVAVARGADVDQPRNLAKSVTVE